MKISSRNPSTGKKQVQFATFTVLLRQLAIFQYGGLNGPHGAVGVWLWKWMEMGVAPALGMRIEGPLESQPMAIKSVEICEFNPIEAYNLDYVVQLGHKKKGSYPSSRKVALESVENVKKFCPKSWKAWSDLETLPDLPTGGIIPGFGWLRDPINAELLLKEEN